MVRTSTLLHYSSYIEKETEEKKMEFWEIKKIFPDMLFLLPKNYDETTKEFEFAKLDDNILSSVEYSNKFTQYKHLLWSNRIISESSIKELVEYLSQFTDAYCYFVINFYLTNTDFVLGIRANTTKTNTQIIITIVEITTMDLTKEIILNYPKI